MALNGKAKLSCDKQDYNNALKVYNEVLNLDKYNGVALEGKIATSIFVGNDYLKERKYEKC